MQLNICVDPDDDARIRGAKGWSELAEILADALSPMEGPCLTSVAALSGLSVQTVYNVRRRIRRPNVATMTALVRVLAPGHVLTLRGACAVPTPISAPSPVIEWRQVPGHPYVGEYVNGKFSGKVERIVPAAVTA